MGPDTEDPYRLLRLAVSGLLLVATGFALVLGLTGVEPRALLLAGAFWSLYGLIIGVIDGLLEPATDALVTAFQNVGLTRADGGYSQAESLVAQANYAAAADAYLERATEQDDVEALVRRAHLLAGPLRAPEAAVNELETRRAGRRLASADDLRVGLALEPPGANEPELAAWNLGTVRGRPRGGGCSSAAQGAAVPPALRVNHLSRTANR